jgi:hypothetical protein
MLRKVTRRLELLRLQPGRRWVFTLALAGWYTLRCLEYGFFAVTYFMSLYQLFLLVQFCTPSGLPDPNDEEFEMPSSALLTSLRPVRRVRQ